MCWSATIAGDCHSASVSIKYVLPLPPHGHVRSALAVQTERKDKSRPRATYNCSNLKNSLRAQQASVMLLAGTDEWCKRILTVLILCVPEIQTIFLVWAGVQQMVDRAWGLATRREHRSGVSRANLTLEQPRYWKLCVNKQLKASSGWHLPVCADTSARTCKALHRNSQILRFVCRGGKWVCSVYR